MKKKALRSPSSRFTLLSLGVLTAAGLGQCFLSRMGNFSALLAGLAFDAVALFLLFRLLPLPTIQVSQDPEKAPGPIRSIEGALFLAILFLAFFFRTHGNAPLAEGLFADRAEVACGALRILNEHWRPGLEALSFHVPELCVYYLVAAWFKFFGASPEAFAYFDATLSTLGLLFFYSVFRRFSGPKVALLAFFLLAVMRWNFVFGRQIYFQAQTVFFSGLTLAFLAQAWRNGKRSIALMGGATAALALYSYQALKALPILLLVLMAFNLFSDRAVFRKKAGIWVAFWLSFFLLALPYLGWVAANRDLGRREGEVSVLVNVEKQKSLQPLFQNLLDAAGMFNRRGDVNSQSNFDDHRMLDDVTGILFILGFFHALRRWRERPYFLALAGLLVMSLPSLLSINGGHAGRMLGTTPFTAYLCALLLGDWLIFAKRVLDPRGSRMAWVPVLFLLGIAGCQNYHLYFDRQALDPDYRNDFSWAETQAGRWIVAQGPNSEFFLSSRFYGHPTVRYLASSLEGSIHPLELSDPPRVGQFPQGKDYCFLMDANKAGVLDLLEKFYPGGQVESFKNPLGQTPLYAYRVSGTALAKVPSGEPRVRRGLQGVYHRSDLGEGIPDLVRWDPILNFTFRDLPVPSSPLQVTWTGRFLVPKTGNYEFLVLTFEDPQLNQARLTLDGKSRTDLVACPSAKATLTKGWHGLELDYRKVASPVATVNLLWKRPGEKGFEFMPNEVFGPIR